VIFFSKNDRTTTLLSKVLGNNPLGRVAILEVSSRTIWNP